MILRRHRTRVQVDLNLEVRGAWARGFDVLLGCSWFPEVGTSSGLDSVVHLFSPLSQVVVVFATFTHSPEAFPKCTHHELPHSSGTTRLNETGSTDLATHSPTGTHASSIDPLWRYDNSASLRVSHLPPLVSES